MKPSKGSDKIDGGTFIEMACDDGRLHARWSDGDGEPVEIAMTISDAEALIDMAQDAIKNYRKEQN